MDTFTGTIAHGHSYREKAWTNKYVGRKVAVVGFGNSALDLAVEMARLCSQVIDANINPFHNYSIFNLKN